VILKEKTWSNFNAKTLLALGCLKKLICTIHTKRLFHRLDNYSGDWMTIRRLIACLSPPKWHFRPGWSVQRFWLWSPLRDSFSTLEILIKFPLTDVIIKKLIWLDIALFCFVLFHRCCSVDLYCQNNIIRITNTRSRQRRCHHKYYVWYHVRGKSLGSNRWLIGLDSNYW